MSIEDCLYHGIGVNCSLFIDIFIGEFLDPYKVSFF